MSMVGTTAKPMLWAYLMVFSRDFGTEAEVLEMLDAHPNVLNWYQCLPHAVFFVSNQTATTISESIRAIRAPVKGTFIVLDVKTDRNGWLPQKAWDFMRRPRPAGEE